MVNYQRQKGKDTFAVGLLARCFNKIFNTYVEDIICTERYFFREEYMDDFWDDPDTEEQNQFLLKENVLTIKPHNFKKRI